MNILIDEYIETQAFSTMPNLEEQSAKRIIYQFIKYVLKDIEKIFSVNLTNDSFIKLNNAVNSLYALYYFVLYKNTIIKDKKTKKKYEIIKNDIINNIYSIFENIECLKKLDMYEKTLKGEDLILYKAFKSTYLVSTTEKEEFLNSNIYKFSIALNKKEEKMKKISLKKEMLSPHFLNEQKTKKNIYDLKVERASLEKIENSKKRETFLKKYESIHKKERENFIDIINARNVYAKELGFNTYYDYTAQGYAIKNKNYLNKLLLSSIKDREQILLDFIKGTYPNIEINKSNIDYYWLNAISVLKKNISTIVDGYSYTLGEVIQNSLDIIANEFNLTFKSIVIDNNSYIKTFEIINNETNEKGLFNIAPEETVNYAVLTNYFNNNKAKNKFVSYIYLYKLEQDWNKKFNLSHLEQIKVLFHEIGHIIHSLKLKYKYDLLNNSVLEAKKGLIPLDLIEYPSVLLEEYSLTTGVLIKILNKTSLTDIKLIQNYLKLQSVKNDLIEELLSYQKFLIFKNKNLIVKYEDLFYKDSLFAFNFLLNEDFFKNFNADSYLTASYTYSLGFYLSKQFLKKNYSVKELFELILKDKKEINTFIKNNVNC